MISLILPAKQSVKKSIEINAPVNVVYQHLKKLENVDSWAVWQSRDSLVKTSITGVDGEAGASLKWSGDPAISGQGEIAIATATENEKIVHNIVFTAPKKGNAQSSFSFREINGKTILDWEFNMATPRPKNIYNLFSNMEKTMGEDFETGLAKVKSEIEKTDYKIPAAKVYEVKQMNFNSTNFAFVRQEIKKSEIGSFYSVHLPAIYSELSRSNITPGTPAGLIYSWDIHKDETDFAVAVIVPEETKLPGPMVQITEIPASKAVYVDYFGAFDKLPDAYSSLQKYLSENNLKQKWPSIEFYLSNPATTDTARWHTQIIYLVE